MPWTIRVKFISLFFSSLHFRNCFKVAYFCSCLPPYPSIRGKMERELWGVGWGERETNQHSDEPHWRFCLAGSLPAFYSCFAIVRLDLQAWCCNRTLSQVAHNTYFNYKDRQKHDTTQKMAPQNLPKGPPATKSPYFLTASTYISNNNSLTLNIIPLRHLLWNIYNDCVPPAG